MPSDSAAGFRAQFNDGRTAASRTVAVRATHDALIVVSDDGAEIDRWLWNDIRLAEPVAASRPFRLSNCAVPGARLTVEDPAALSVLRGHARYLDGDPLNRKRLAHMGWIGAAAVAVVLFFIYGLPWIARPVAALIPVSWEEPVGESTVNIVNALFADGRPLCRNEAGVAALKKLTGTLRGTIDTPYSVRVQVADSDLVNALAVPGGRIVLFRGLIDKASAPDEVAGVLAHELAHVRHRHPTLGMINSVGWSALISVFTGGASMSSEAIARLAAHLATSAHTRDLETEADENAVSMLNESGIGSGGLTRFFESIRDHEIKGLALPAYLSTHPATDDRIAAIEARPTDARIQALSDAEWQALRSICRNDKR